MDLSDMAAVSLAQNGAVKALVIDDPYTIGKCLVDVIGYSLLGKQAPASIPVPAVLVTKAVMQAYADNYHTKPLPEVLQTAGQ